MNVQDAIRAINEVIERNGKHMDRLQEVKHFANDAEATLAQHLGPDNESVALLGQVSAQSETASSACAAFGVELEHLNEILASIQ